jgi:phosphohistidine phosphatase
MARELLLLRHGKSDWAAGYESDFQRPLAKRGRKAALRVGRWMREQGLQPDCVLSSPAVRARDTTRAVCKKLDLPEQAVTWTERIYDADLTTLLEVLADCPSSGKRVLLVGHNPGLEDLLAHLCAGASPGRPEGKLLPTAAVARIVLPDDWSALEAGCGRCAEIARPRDLESEG